MKILKPFAWMQPFYKHATLSRFFQKTSRISEFIYNVLLRKNLFKEYFSMQKKTSIYSILKNSRPNFRENSYYPHFIHLLMDDCYKSSQ